MCVGSRPFCNFASGGSLNLEDCQSGQGMLMLDSLHCRNARRLRRAMRNNFSTLVNASCVAP
jgi:hypothetical protein